MFKTFEIKIDALLKLFQSLQRGNATSYLIASAIVLVALLVRLAIAPTEAGVPFLTFFPAVTLAALFGGFGPGLFAMMICSILASYMFIPPFNTFSLTFNGGVIWSNFVFIIEELTVITVINAMFRQHNKLQHSNIALEESLDRYMDLFDFAPVGYLTLTDKGLITEINLTGASLLGLDRKEILHRYIGSFFTPTECDRWHLHNLRTLKHNDKQSCEFIMRRDDGTIFFSLLDCQRRNTLTSATVRVSFTDITERKKLEQQLRQSQKMQVLGQLTGGIAHDFNNILAVMLGYSNLALTRYATDKESKLAHYLEEVIKAGERARDLVARMLTYSRGQADEVVPVIDPAPLVKEAIKMLASTIQSSIKLQDQFTANIPAICISPGELHQIVMNLVINARDAMAEHGCLNIRLTTLEETSEFCRSCKRAKRNVLCLGDIRGKYVSLSVTDTGCGISPENFELILDPFFTTKDVGKGTGLGLSVVQGIVRRAGGCIVIDSHLGMGTTVQVLFPVAEAFVDLPPATVPSPEISGSNGARILVVDDESALAHYLGDVLEGENYEADVYTDSVKALNYFCANPQSIDAVITDQTMPNKSGIEIARVMLELRPELPIFLCSGYSNTIDEAGAQSFGIRRFFYKPVSATELLTALDEEIGVDAYIQRH